MQMLGMDDPVVAVLFQNGPTPDQGGGRKPAKPGGYRDSAADIAYALVRSGIRVLTPAIRADPGRDLDWAFRDDADGIRNALEAGATVLWANTTLYQGHPITQFANAVGVVGPSIALVDRFEDKWVMNQWLQVHGFPVPKMWPLSFTGEIPETSVLVRKPRRGRGSQGVERVLGSPTFNDSAGSEPNGFVIEEYLPGEEVTVTVMPPGSYTSDPGVTRIPEYWALPPVTRRDHRDGIIPYSGDIPVVENSFVGGPPSLALKRLVVHCEAMAEQLHSRAWLRIDARQDLDGVYRIMDVNFKPNLTGPGRPGRERAVSLVALAAESYGWSYETLVSNLLQCKNWRFAL